MAAPEGTQSQPKEQWLRVDGVEDDRQFNKVKRPFAPQPPPARSRGYRSNDLPDLDPEDFDSPPAIPDRDQDEAHGEADVHERHSGRVRGHVAHAGRVLFGDARGPRALRGHAALRVVSNFFHHGVAFAAFGACPWSGA